MCADGARRSQDSFINIDELATTLWTHRALFAFQETRKPRRRNQGAEPETELIIRFFIKATYEF